MILKILNVMLLSLLHRITIITNIVCIYISPIIKEDWYIIYMWKNNNHVVFYRNIEIFSTKEHCVIRLPWYLLRNSYIAWSWSNFFGFSCFLFVCFFYLFTSRLSRSIFSIEFSPDCYFENFNELTSYIIELNNKWKWKEYKLSDFTNDLTRKKIKILV